MENKKTIKKFIEDKTDLQIYEIYSISLKDYSDGLGDIGKHYIVRTNTNKGKKTCYVNRELLDCYQTKINVVIVE